MSDNSKKQPNSETTEQRRDEMLKRLLKTPPQPRPKKERDESVQPKRKKAKKTPDK